MTPPAPLVFVTLPGRTIRELQEQIRAAAMARADVAEVRIDRLEESERARVAELFPAPLPLLGTYRSIEEGGRAGASASRPDVLAQVGSLPFAWIDREADRDPRDVPATSVVPDRRYIVSTHLLGGEPPGDLGRRLREPLPPRTIRKFVIDCSIARWLLEIVPALPPPEESTFVVLATGAAGPLSRADARRTGSAAVFAALPAEAEGVSLRPVEPSQLPIDRLAPYLRAERLGPLFGVAGHPIDHSRSPGIHHAWMRGEGRLGVYVPLDFANDEEFVACLPALASAGFRGINVTHPFKAIALSAASRVGRAAEVCGAANCLTFEGSEVEAQNTDLAAVLRRLTELKESHRWDGRSVSVVGTGGAARATLAAARELRAESRVYARRAGGGTALASEFGARAAEPGEGPPPSLLVHATPVGRRGSGPLEVPLAGLVGDGTHVLDWVYAPDDSELRTAVTSTGGTYEDGTRLLVYQAAESYAVWWGEPPSDAAVAAALRGVG